jgi:hypothetical protein
LNASFFFESCGSGFEFSSQFFFLTALLFLSLSRFLFLTFLSLHGCDGGGGFRGFGSGGLGFGG